ncbi:MAG: HIT domain-containing protein [Campylobacteraceae bacterium]|jgi:diadenosine tetraphosphate (Ap4A) HIT family hydrolase|nr:HIT domain-containing protein [Campylobacteraceae bacterium]MBT3882432.1 HIT domain-containing protein [Campylobacteraceae bacterium]MBT4030639.1 HIT domain-containing protein [Campylobacteraceae bacterium]MBT4179715.1 HIT domain-containing protein [Campylobacteraceae bacterium]MBT4571888.1 HIT domain-containing protein [Campylobacteraceae bacterium]
MERLYSPWRSEYVSTHKNIDGCVFCHITNNPDDSEDLGVLYRDEYCFIVMNKYPYSPGHFMVIPHLHTDKLEDLDPEIWAHMTKLAQNGVSLLKDVLNAQGVNLGMNLGQVGGAGIAEHIHFHAVPRWMGDTNFITSIGDTRIFSTDFEKIYKRLLEEAPKYFPTITK